MESQRLVIFHGANNATLDVTENILVPSYAVSKNKGYETWTDSNYTTHKHLVATKATGSFTVKFFTVNDYINFNKFITDNTDSDGAIYATLYYNNLNTTEKIRVFVSYELTDILPLIERKEYDGIEISISER